ncbi:O-antigen ligase family protein [Candidatus Thioglobus sp.]|nr:O-antigen ligase family protein [Candidatus Thioglobus sp.]
MNITNKLLLLINFLMGLLIFILPTALAAIPKGGSIVVLMLILSVVGLTIKRERMKLNKWEKYFVFSFVFYFAVIAINLWWFDGYLRDLDTPSRLILVLPIYFFIRKTDVSANWLIWGIVLGAIVSGVIKFGMIDVIYLSKVVSIQTGVFSLFSSIFGLSSLMFINKDNSYVKNFIFFTAFVFGILASILSGGRGVWISAFLSFLIVLFVNPINWKLRVRFIVMLLFFSIFMSAYLVPQTGVKSRIDTALNNVVSWSESGKANTSAGARLEMWKTSYIIIKDNTLIGVGEDNYAKHQKKIIDKGEVSKFVGNFSHPHNEYITSLIEQGAIGLLAFILLLLFPLKYLFVSMKLEIFNFHQRQLVIVGMFLILHYLFYSFTATVFAHQSTALFFAVILVVVIGHVSFNRRLVK